MAAFSDRIDSSPREVDPTVDPNILQSLLVNVGPAFVLGSLAQQLTILFHT